ncbi:MAG: hypothetical protein V7603_2075 [Micromonosporaceae bacterium]
MRRFTVKAMGGTGSVWPAVDQDRGPVPTTADVRGVWRRSLIEWADGSRDETTAVRWVQGISWYGDLRQPVGAPSFAGVGCLRDLSEDHLGWLARQQAFAGSLEREDGCFRWGHLVDLDVHGGQPDVGWLAWDGDALVETGRYLPYREAWQRVPAGGQDRVAGLRLRDSCTGQAGLVVRVGSAFAYARARPGGVPHGLRAGGLPELVRDMDPPAAQDLLDCEVSLGEVGAGGWVIDRSSLPFRMGSRLDTASPGVRPGDRRRAGLHHAVTADVSPTGMPVTRTWQVVGVEGEVDALAAFTG